MSETTEKDSKKTTRLSSPGRLELKKTVQSGEVRQSFSHGRTKAVTVEVKKKRTYKRGAGGTMEVVKEPVAVLPTTTPEQAAAAASDQATTADGRALTEMEREARAKALEEVGHGELGADPALPGKAPTVEGAGAAQQNIDEDARRQSDLHAQQLAEKEVGVKATRPAPRKAASPRTRETTEAEEEKEGGGRARRGRADARRPTPTPRRTEPRRREAQLTVSKALEAADGADERVRSLASVRRAREKEKLQQQQQLKKTRETQVIVRDVVIPENLTVQELANRLAARGAEVVKVLMKLDVTATINQVIDGDTAELVVAEFGHKVKRVAESDVEIGLKGEPDDPAKLQPRPPVVTVMGHVDHGKTSLLDALRNADVASGEAGGITQHIGAYQTNIKSGARITFLDTPGHEAFTAMRARGSKLTDIIVLVVAADDGVQPQTVEAINHAKAAEVPLVIAVNKIDKPDSDPSKVRQELLQHGIVVEDLAGDVLAVDISAKEATNLDALEEAILLQTELLDLKADPDRSAEGMVIEARLEHGRGPVATVLVQRGTLKVGDIFIAGTEWGRVRALIDDRGGNVDSAGPATPVEALGLNGTPSAGDDVAVVDSEARAREVTEYRRRQSKVVTSPGAPIDAEEIFSKIASGEADELPLVLKADVRGSIEAIIGAIDKLSTDEVSTRFLHSGVGGINESDVALAAASKGLVIGFNVRANRQATELTQRDGVEIRYYSVIYELLDEVKSMLSGMLAPAIHETVIGNAEVREVFSISKVGKVAGCAVIQGNIRRGANVRLLRDDVVVHEGKLDTLKRFKDEVKEVKEGQECGMSLENYQDIKQGDVIQCYEVEEVAREL